MAKAISWPTSVGSTRRAAPLEVVAATQPTLTAQVVTTILPGTKASVERDAPLPGIPSGVLVYP